MDSRPRVAVRIRPSNDGSGCLQLAGGGTVILREQAFKFDHLFDGASGQEDVRGRFSTIFGRSPQPGCQLAPPPRRFSMSPARRRFKTWCGAG
jgi:hypothetical protein